MLVDLINFTLTSHARGNSLVGSIVTCDFNLLCSIPLCYFIFVFISIQKILDELNQCYITPIRRIFRALFGAWGWLSFAHG